MAIAEDIARIKHQEQVLQFKSMTGRFDIRVVSARRPKLCFFKSLCFCIFYNRAK